MMITFINFEGFCFVTVVFFGVADADLLTFANLSVLALTVFMVVFLAAFTTPFVFVVFVAGFVVVFLATIVRALLAVFATFSLLVVLFFTVLTTFFGGMLSPVRDCFAGFESPDVVDFASAVLTPFRVASTLFLFTRNRPFSDIPAIGQDCC